jgi:hypothetical protein
MEVINKKRLVIGSGRHTIPTLPMHGRIRDRKNNDVLLIDIAYPALDIPPHAFYLVRKEVK